MKPWLIPILVIIAHQSAAQRFNVADSLIENSQYERAIQWIDNRLTNKINDDEKLLLQAKKVDALIRAGKFSDAEVLLKDISPRATSLYLQAIVQMNYGSLFLHQGLYDQSLDVLQVVMQLLEKEKKENTLEAAQALSYLGNLYRATGKYAQAEEQLNHSLAIRQKLLKANDEWIAASYNDLGLVYSQTDHDKALEYYEMALKIYQQLHGKDHPKIAIASTNIGFMYVQLELFGDAINNFESALKIWEKIYPQAHPTKAFLLFSLGETYSKIHDTKAADGYYQRALSTYLQSYGSKHPDVATVYNALGNASLAAGKFAESLDYYQKALIANVRNFNATSVTQNPALHEFYNGRILLNSLLYKAQAMEATYFSKSIRISDLQRGIATLQVCDTLIDRLRQRINNESDKISLGVIANEVYASGVRLAFETADVALHKKQWYKQSFYFAEKSKSAVLLEAISDANAKSFARIPDTLLEEEKKLKASIALATQQLAEKPSDQEEQSLREQIFTLNRSYETFTRKLEREFPQYYNLKYNATSPSISELQQRLDDHTAIISYFIDDKHEELYTFIITREHYTVSNKLLSPDLDKNVTGLRNGLYFNAPEAYQRAATSLSRDLVPRHLSASITDLVIIPTGRLSIIPFETLFSRTLRDGENDKDIPYLLKVYSIRYEFSASLILQKTLNEPAEELSIFLCAPVVFNPVNQLQELPGTESEVNDISQLFETKKLRHAVFTRKDADEKLAKSGTLKNYSYLHFATHGIVDERSPELSRIFLQSSTASEDGSLFTGEIYNLELNADLVTLSACQTGLGKISKGEGVIGLSRSLVYAGARNVMVSFWSVADESTAILMKSFYRYMLEDKNRHYNQDLRKAKLDLMKTEKYRSPYYWAPFVLIGF
ncbi:MAG TPA: CHAT domain-containing tetratricopeptide repeat protein [Chryseolinea sp.]|nr:CHAT domain-containing tetratricopeptide repeat protein [Chryseolinea sp.]